jgi:hypothetical protein
MPPTTAAPRTPSQRSTSRPGPCDACSRSFEGALGSIVGPERSSLAALGGTAAEGTDPGGALAQPEVGNGDGGVADSTRAGVAAIVLTGVTLAWVMLAGVAVEGVAEEGVATSGARGAALSRAASSTARASASAARAESEARLVSLRNSSMRAER